MAMTSGFFVLGGICGAIGAGVAALIAVFGWVWLIVQGFRDKSWWWGLIVMLLPPIGGILFGFMRWPKTKQAFIIYCLGLLLGGGSAASL